MYICSSFLPINLSQVSNQISDPGTSRELGISNYKFFMKCFRLLMDGPDISHRLLAIAVKGYGHFAKVELPFFHYMY